MDYPLPGEVRGMSPFERGMAHVGVRVSMLRLMLNGRGDRVGLRGG